MAVDIQTRNGFRFTLTSRPVTPTTFTFTTTGQLSGANTTYYKGLRFGSNSVQMYIPMATVIKDYTFSTLSFDTNTYSLVAQDTNALSVVADTLFTNDIISNTTVESLLTSSVLNATIEVEDLESNIENNGQGYSEI